MTRYLLLFEFLFWLSVGGAVFLTGLASGVTVICGVLLGIFVLRLGIMGSSFVYAIARSPKLARALKTGLIGGVWTLLKEAFWVTLAYSLFMPFERFWLQGDRLADVVRGRVPILLVHGFSCNRGVWVRVARVLHKAGWPVTSVNLEPPHANIDHFATQLARRIEEVLRTTGSEQLILVCHSMGGLVARRYLDLHGEMSVKAVITLGTPHHGSLLARYGMGDCAREMEPDSEWLAKLPQSLKVPFVSIYSMHDNLVVPATSSRLQGARNVTLTGVGHICMLFSDRLSRHLLRELAGVR